jgi:hypothetical protein
VDDVATWKHLLLVVTAGRLRTRFKLDVRVRTSVEAIDRVAKKVLARDLASGREHGEPYDKLILAPGAGAMTLKLLFDPETGKVLGAQAVGGAGVDKRVDVLAVAIQAGLTVLDLEGMELGYSPQYGSAKDPINMAGFVASGLLRGEHPKVDVGAVLAAPAARHPFVVDVRTPQEFGAGHLPEAVNTPVDDLRTHPQANGR